MPTTACANRYAFTSATKLHPSRIAIDGVSHKLKLDTRTASTQGVAVVRKLLAENVFRVAPEKIRVRTGDVGGGFGMKTQAYPEYAALLFAARRLDRPVRWCASRIESFLSDTHGRDGES